MSNRGFLSTSNLAALYPGIRGKDDIDHEVIAASVNCVPALWLAGVASEDLVRDQVVAPGGEVVAVVGPVADRARFLARVPAGAARIARALGADDRALDAHAELFAAALASARGAYVTCELEEIWAIYPDGLDAFDRDLRAAVAGDAAAIARLAGWEGGLTIPRADLWLASADARPGDGSLNQILGHSHVRAVPWERPLPPLLIEEPLIAALLESDFAEARRLLAEGAAVDVTTQRGRSSALVLAAARDEAMALELLDRGASLDEQALVLAVQGGRVALTERLLALGADPNTMDRGFQVSVLARACQAAENAEVLVRRLLAAGADPNAGDMTPLMAALGKANGSLVRLLLERGARIDAVDKRGRSVSTWAERSKDPELIALIAERVEASR